MFQNERDIYENEQSKRKCFATVADNGSLLIYLYDHPAGDKEIGGGEEDQQRVCIARGKQCRNQNMESL